MYVDYSLGSLSVRRGAKHKISRRAAQDRKERQAEVEESEFNRQTIEAYEIPRTLTAPLADWNRGGKGAPYSRLFEAVSYGTDYHHYIPPKARGRSHKQLTVAIVRSTIEQWREQVRRHRKKFAKKAAIMGAIYVTSIVTAGAAASAGTSTAGASAGTSAAGAASGTSGISSSFLTAGKAVASKAATGLLKNVTAGNIKSVANTIRAVKQYRRSAKASGVSPDEARMERGILETENRIRELESGAVDSQNLPAQHSTMPIILAVIAALSLLK